MVSMVNELSAKHPTTLAVLDTILLYHLIKVKPKLDVKVERPGGFQLAQLVKFLVVV